MRSEILTTAAAVAATAEAVAVVVAASSLNTFLFCGMPQILYSSRSGGAEIHSQSNLKVCACVFVTKFCRIRLVRNNTCWKITQLLHGPSTKLPTLSPATRRTSALRSNSPPPVYLPCKKKTATCRFFPWNDSSSEDVVQEDRRNTEGCARITQPGRPQQNTARAATVLQRYMEKNGRGSPRGHSQPPTQELVSCICR